MTSNTITRSASQVQSVREYSLTLVNISDNDTQELIAAFSSEPTVQDWQQWLAGWQSCD